jgi:hypothetical protein
VLGEAYPADREIETDVDHGEEEHDEVGDDEDKGLKEHAGLAKVVADLEVLVVLGHDVLLVENEHGPAGGVEVSVVELGLLRINSEGQLEAGVPELKRKERKKDIKV